MDDIMDSLTLTILYRDIRRLSMEVEPNFNFILLSLINSFNEEMKRDYNVNRYAQVCAQLIVLTTNDALKQYTNEDEVEALITKLTNEKDILRSTIEQLTAIETSQSSAMPNETKGDVNRSVKNNSSPFQAFDKRFELLTSF